MGDVIVGAFKHPSSLPPVRGEPSGSPFADRVAVQMRTHASAVVGEVSRMFRTSSLPTSTKEREVAVGLIMCMIGVGMVRNATSYRRARSMILGAVRAALSAKAHG